MVFLPGDHTLDTNITVANVAGLTLHGESSSGNGATVVCSGSVGLSFTSIYGGLQNVFISFYLLNRRLKYVSDFDIVYGALGLQSTKKLVDCSSHDNMATALVYRE